MTATERDKLRALARLHRRERDARDIARGHAMRRGTRKREYSWERRTR